MENHVTITQIAKESGVSISTVSRVMNGNVPVASDKRKRVEEVIKKYDFTPNALARGLVKRQSMTIGIVIPDISNPYFSAVFLEIERYAMEAGYSVFLCNTLFGSSSNESQSTRKEEDYFQIMINNQVDGVLIMGGEIDLDQVSDDYRKALARLRNFLPVVVIGKPIKETNCIFIQKESSSGMITAVNYLHSLGHRRITFVGGQSGVSITTMRLTSYQLALEKLNIPFDQNLVSLSDYYAKAGFNAMETLLARNVKFSACICMNDMVALGANRSLCDHGLSVPHDIAIISCDQFPNGEYAFPRLTSIDQHNGLFGRMVIMALIDAINKSERSIERTIPPELVVRESCGTHLGKRHFNY